MIPQKFKDKISATNLNKPPTNAEKNKEQQTKEKRTAPEIYRYNSRRKIVF